MESRKCKVWRSKFLLMFHIQDRLSSWTVAGLAEFSHRFGWYCTWRTDLEEKSRIPRTETINQSGNVLDAAPKTIKRISAINGFLFVAIQLAHFLYSLEGLILSCNSCTGNQSLRRSSGFHQTNYSLRDNRVSTKYLHLLEFSVTNEQPCILLRG